MNTASIANIKKADELIITSILDLLDSQMTYTEKNTINPTMAVLDIVRGRVPKETNASIR